MATNDEVPRTSVNQAPYGGTDYPFTAHVTGNLTGVVLDAYASYYDPTGAYALPLHLTSAGANVVLADAAGTVILETTPAAARTRAWGARTVYEWVADPVVLRLVLDGAFQDGHAVLDPRTCNRLAPHVRSFWVGGVRLTGPVKFEAGYNVTLTGTDDAAGDERYAPVVAMDAVPGAGTGRVPGCPEVDVLLRKINQVRPDCAGNFVIELDDCFRGQPPLTVTGAQDAPRTAVVDTPGAMTLYSDCYPCCSCDAYVRTYRGLKRMWDRWASVATDAQEARDTYASNRARWIASGECRAANPARLVASAVTGCRTYTGGSFCNATECCLTGVELRFTFQRYLAGVEVAWGTATVAGAAISGSPYDGDEAYAPDTVGGRVVRFFYDYADPQAASVAKFYLSTPGCVAGGSVRVTMTAHAATPVGGCETPAASVPADIAAIWSALGVPATPTVRAVVDKTVGLTP